MAMEVEEQIRHMRTYVQYNMYIYVWQSRIEIADYSGMAKMLFRHIIMK